MTTDSGTLHVVASPIGNLDDFSLRAQNVLREVDRILAEDTRVSRRLLVRYEIHTPMEAYHDHNKEKISPRLVEVLKSGLSLALISDAGTPGVADPAFYLVREAVRAGIPVSPAPGANAALAALVCSGLPTDRFTFDNFFPVKPGKKRKLLEQAREQGRTVICYESPHRIKKTLKAMEETLGDVAVVLGREITKVHEEFLRGTPAQLLAHFEDRQPRGEFVVVFNCTTSW